MPFNVWTTKHRAPMLMSEVEKLVYGCIRETSEALNSPILALNGLEDHVHVTSKISLKIAVSDWVQRIKGASARAVNSTYPDLAPRFRWQEGYGVLTFGAKKLSFVAAYIEQQKSHHAQNGLEKYLETTDDDHDV